MKNSKYDFMNKISSDIKIIKNTSIIPTETLDDSLACIDYILKSMDNQMEEDYRIEKNKESLKKKIRDL